MGGEIIGGPKKGLCLNMDELRKEREATLQKWADRLETEGDKGIDREKCKAAYKEHYVASGSFGFPHACVAGPFAIDGEPIDGKHWSRKAKKDYHMSLYMKRHQLYVYTHDKVERFYVVLPPDRLFQ